MSRPPPWIRYGRNPSLRMYEQAREQHGVVTRAQALRGGISQDALERRRRDGGWEEVCPGVYRMPGAPDSWEGKLKAALLWAGRGAALSHRAAALLWGLDGIEEAPVEITVARHVRAPGVIAHRSRLPRLHVGKVEGFRVTSAARTILDLGAVVNRSIVERAMDDALHRRLTSLGKLREVLEVAGGPGRAGTAILRALLVGRDPRSAPPESLLEARLAKVLAASSLPPAVPQHPIREGSRLLARVDFAWPDHLVALEADGFLHHGSASAVQRDRARDNRLVARGWRVLRVNWEDVMQRPAEVVRSVAAALRA